MGNDNRSRSRGCYTYVVERKGKGAGEERAMEAGSQVDTYMAYSSIFLGNLLRKTSTSSSLFPTQSIPSNQPTKSQY